MSSLAGVGVLVTRAAHQAVALCEAIRAEGGTPWPWPTLQIDACADPAALRGQLAPLTQYDWLIFVSANAVEHGLAVLSPLPHSLAFAAVGQATAELLSERLSRPVLAPAGDAGSEGLLAAAELADVAGKRILIVRGQDGRELLAEALRERGAEVRYAAVYRRRRPLVDAARLDALETAWAAGAIEYVQAGSVAALVNLHAMLSARGRELLSRSVLVSASARVIKEGTELGIERTQLAASPDDRAMIDAIVDHRCRAAPPRRPP